MSMSVDDGGDVAEQALFCKSLLYLVVGSKRHSVGAIGSVVASAQIVVLSDIASGHVPELCIILRLCGKM